MVQIQSIERAAAVLRLLTGHSRRCAPPAPDVGSLMPLHATALDRALLTEGAQNGWACDVGEFLPGVASVAAPIGARDRVAHGAIAVSGPIARICQDGSPRPELVGYVMDSARRISHELGARPW